MLCLRRIALRACSIRSTPIIVSNRSITALTPTLTLHQLDRPSREFLSWQRRFAHKGKAQAQPEANGAKEAQHGIEQVEPEADGAEETQHGDGSVSEASLSEASLSDSSVSESTISDSTLSEESHAEAPENSTRLTSRPDSEDRPTLWSTVESVAEKVAGNASKAAQSVTAGTEEAIDYMSDGLGFSREDRPYQEPEPSRGLYVGNLFFDVTPAQLREEFEKAGKLVKAEIARDARGFSKGFGYVQYEDQETADKAKEMFRDKMFEGRRLNVQYSRPQRDRLATDEGRPTNPPSKTLFIGNMAFEMSDRDLNNLFSKIQNVVDVRVAIDRRTGQPRGFAHADFTDVASATKAMQELTNREVCGRVLRLDYSFRESHGRGRSEQR